LLGDVGEKKTEEGEVVDEGVEEKGRGGRTKEGKKE